MVPSERHTKNTKWTRITAIGWTLRVCWHLPHWIHMLYISVLLMHSDIDTLHWWLRLGYNSKSKEKGQTFAVRVLLPIQWHRSLKCSIFSSYPIQAELPCIVWFTQWRTPTLMDKIWIYFPCWKFNDSHHFNQEDSLLWLFFKSYISYAIENQKVSQVTWLLLSLF